MGKKEDRARYRAKMALTHRWGKAAAVNKETLVAMVTDLAYMLEYAESHLPNQAEGVGNLMALKYIMRLARDRAEVVLEQDRESKINRWRLK